ncbi:hypothetical protein ACQ3G6_17370 [Allorhizobium undicola]|uniref:hypothetical protein n=1 Tax=Allorhizobium undicola TaxID=78527 RepID=UPI003D34497A
MEKDMTAGGLADPFEPASYAPEFVPTRKPLPDKVARPAPAAAVKHGVYIASKTRHADRWRKLRDKLGEPVISTWIDEAGVGETSDFADLWRRCILEASTAQVLIVYMEPGEVLKGAWVEVGAALASGVQVLAVGIENFSIAKDARIQHFRSMRDAIVASRAIRSALTTAPAHPDDIAVDRFAAAMKVKLAKKRSEGRGGWEDKSQCTNEFLSRLLKEHVEKGDPVDVGNLAMMIHQRGERITTPPDQSARIAELEAALAGKWLPIELADKTITHVQGFPEVGITIKTSDRYWVRDADGRIYEAAWSEGEFGRDFWWDFEAESPVDPVEFMPHPLAALKGKGE